MNFWQKILTCIGVLLLCMAAGTGGMMLVLSTIGIGPEQITNLADLSLNSSQSRILKIGFGINHLLSFVVSGFILIYIFSKKKIVKYTGINRGFNGVLFLKFMALLIITYPILSSVIGLMQYIDLPEWANNMDDQNIAALKSLLGMDTIIDFLLNFMIIAVFAGVGEELVFRGIIQKELYNNLSPTWSILIAAFIFAAFHLEVSGLIPKFIIGLVLGLSYFVTSNIIYPILLHTLNNGMQVSILYFGGQAIDQIDTSPEIPSLTSILGGLIFIPAVIMLSIHLLNYKVDGPNS